MVAFFRACLFSFISCSLSFFYGSAGWLMHWLFMFSDVFCMPMLFWYCRRHMDAQRGFALQENLILWGAAALLGILEYFYISPFLLGVI